MNDVISQLVVECITQYAPEGVKLSNLLDCAGLVVEDNTNIVNLRNFMKAVKEVDTEESIRVSLSSEELFSLVGGK